MDLEDFEHVPDPCSDDQFLWVEEIFEKRAELERKEAFEALVEASREHYAAIKAEEHTREVVFKLLTTQEEHSFCLSWLEEQKLEIEEASLNYEKALQRCVKADLNLRSIRLSNEARAARALKEVDNKVTGAEEGTEEGVIDEVEQVTMASTIIESFEGDVMVEEEVQLETVVQEKGHLVEPEHIDFIFAPVDFRWYEKARLLEFLPKIFSFSNRSRSWRYVVPCHTHSRRASPFCYKPEPMLSLQEIS